MKWPENLNVRSQDLEKIYHDAGQFYWFRVEDFMKEKNQQDTYKKNKDEKYNPALRETEKLLMNSLSGKVIEGLHTEKTEAINSVSEYEKYPP